MLVSKKTHPNPKSADSTKCVPVLSSCIINFLSIQVLEKIQVKYEGLNSGKVECRPYLQMYSGVWQL